LPGFAAEAVGECGDSRTELLSRVTPRDEAACSGRISLMRGGVPLAYGRVAIGRRVFLAAAAALLTAPSATAVQGARRVPLVGCLTPSERSAPNQEDFRRGLRDLGYVEDQNIVLEYRSGFGRHEQLRKFAAELVNLRVDVLFTTGTEATAAAQAATTAVPIVAVTGDPVASGFVASLARPAGNVTGLAIVTPELSTKWVELVREMAPRASRVAVLMHREDGGPQMEALDPVARRLGLEVIALRLRSTDEIEAALDRAVGARANAVIALASPAFTLHRNRIVALAARHRLPAVYEHRLFVDAGGLVSYGADLRLVFSRAAAYVDKILKGAKPADLPVEQPSRFELVINMRTAKALGLAVPTSLLVRADHFIE
jgi:putative ABC transport system substrate-binding protein